MRGVLFVWLVATAWPHIGGAHDVGRANSDQINLLLDAIAAMESGNNPTVVGDGGKALGLYQIHRAYWADGTRLLGVDWRYEQAADPVRAREVVKAYLLHYGRGRSLLEMARIHNGGPNGHRKQSTQEYARRIARAVENASVVQ